MVFPVTPMQFYRKILNCDKELYLLRVFLIRTKKFAVYFHKFYRSDEDRALHDHPWNFIVIPLWRGYIEHSEDRLNHERKSQKRVWPIIGTRFRDRYYRHRVELIDGKPAYSLFIRFSRKRTWGFWERGNFISWKRWDSERC